MAKLHIVPSEDGTAVSLAADTTDPIAFGAEALDRLIATLVAIRAHMSPALTQEQFGEPSHRHHATRPLVLTPSEDDPFRLKVALFHPGLGWLVSHLRIDQARELRRHLDDAIAELPRV